jgi:hypothetical protein
VGVDGGLDHALGQVLLGVLHDGHDSLAVDDGLDFINYIRPHSLLQAGRHFYDASLVGSGGLLDVLLNVVDHVPVNLAVDDGLHLHDAVLPDGLLHDGSIIDGLHWLLDSLLLESLLLELSLLEWLLDGGLLDGSLLSHTGLQGLLLEAGLPCLLVLVLVLVGNLVQKTGHVGYMICDVCLSISE